MKKIMTLFVILAVVLMAGCSVVDRFKTAEKQYLDNRVAELLDEMPTEVVQSVEPLVTEEAKIVETEEMVEETAETPEPTVEVTETPVIDATEEPIVEPTVESIDPAVYLGTPTWVDEMEKAEFWVAGSDEYTSAVFENGGMTLKALTETPGWRVASTAELSKAYIEATFKTGACSGSDGYGLLVRIPRNVNFNQGYFITLTCDGRYSIRMWNGLSGDKGVSVMVKALTASELINKGKDQTNRLGVATVGDRLTLFINGEMVDGFTDETYPSGYFGVFVNQDVTKDLTVYVNQVQYWTDPEIK